MRKQFVSVFLASLMTGVLPWSLKAAAVDSSTPNTVQRYTNQQNVQIYNLGTEHGGTVSLGQGTTNYGFQVYYDTPTQSAVRHIKGMPTYDGGVIYASTGAVITTATFQGVLQVSTITAASSNAYGSITLPVNYLTPGKMIRMTVMGTFSTTQIPGSAVFAVKLGSTTIGTTGGVQLPGAVSSQTFALNGILSCVSTGSFVGGISSATVQFTVSVASGTSQAPSSPFVIGNSTNNVAQISTVKSNDLNVVVGFTQTNQGNVLVINSIVYEDLN